MKKLLFILNVILMSSAQAGTFLPAVQAMVSLGVTDPATVRHNTGVYLGILSSIDKNISNQKLVMNEIQDLSDRLEKQMSLLGYDFSMMLAPSLTLALSDAKVAAQQKNAGELKKNIAEARKQLLEIRKGI